MRTILHLIALGLLGFNPVFAAGKPDMGKAETPSFAMGMLGS